MGASNAGRLSEEKDAANTPMMRQYMEAKSLHPDCILFFRLGDFYEMFFEDALKASELLQIALTARSKGPERVPMCGVPAHSARRYIAKLIEHGLKVAICEQVEEPGKGPGIVRREVIRIITPGMVLDEDVLDASANNYLAALQFSENGFGAAFLDASTGEFWALEAASAAELAEHLARAEIRELVVAEDMLESAELAGLLALLSRRPALGGVEPQALQPARAQAYLKEHFKVASLDGFGLSQSPLAMSAAGAALRYLKDTQRHDASHVDRIRMFDRGQHLLLDGSSRANLEVVRTLRDGTRRGALVGVLDRTATPPGARKLASWLTTPLRSLPEIGARHDAVGELAEHAVWREELWAELKGISDIERLCARLSLGAGNARDLRNLAVSLAAMPKVALILQRCQAGLLRAMGTPLVALPELTQVLLSAVEDEPPLSLKEGGFIRRGFHAELDEYVQLSSSGKETLLQIEAREKERTGISSLKVRYNKVFGYYLEVTRSNLHLVPQDYIRKQTTVGAERFITPELKEYEEKVLHAEERRCELELRIFDGLRSQVVRQASQIRAAAEALATVDALLSFARCAAEYGYVRPTVDDTDTIEIQGGRHPVVERMLDGEIFVPNDIVLDGSANQLLVITGPNMAGKSTVMRQVALCALMAQAGSFVPARSARIGLCDRIFTRVGAADNLAKGQSTFMVEMAETSYILHHATAKSLLVLDEIGRGTSTFDGLSIAWAVAEHIHNHVGARTLFATHYHELTALAREHPRVKNCSIAVKEQKGRILFLRKLVSGGASRSYGIEVARLAGLPSEVLGRAREILARLEAGESMDAGSTAQLGLFSVPAIPEVQNPVVSQLQELNLDAVTPLEALNLLARWKKELSSSLQGCS